MTEYMIAIVGDADRWWTSMSPAEVKSAYAEYERFGAELSRRGHQVTGGAELHATTEAKHLKPGGVITDGPFAEGVEQLGGFYLVETEDIDDVLDCCQILTALGEGIEIRRVVTDQERDR